MKKRTEEIITLVILYLTAAIDIIIAYLNTSIIGTIATIFFAVILLYYATILIIKTG